MSATEKFMFDTIFDDLEPIQPELAEDSEILSADRDELLEPEIEEEIAPTFSEEEVDAVRQEGIATGREQGVSETLAGLEKSSSDALTMMVGKVETLFAIQEQTNTELSYDATALALAIVRKFFPTLNEESALNEVVLTVEQVLDRLINETGIRVKVNPGISEALTEKLMDQNLTEKLSVIADEKVNLGDCNIGWSSGTAKRNLAALMGEIDGIIAQNSTVPMDSLSVSDTPETTPPEELTPVDAESAENIANVSENGEEIPGSEAAFEQNVKDEELVLENADSEEISTEGSENEEVVESSDENDQDQNTEEDNTP